MVRVFVSLIIFILILIYIIIRIIRLYSYAMHVLRNVVSDYIDFVLISDVIRTGDKDILKSVEKLNNTMVVAQEFIHNH